MARWKATATGWDGREVRRPGEVFEADLIKPSWAVLVDPLDHDADGKKGGSESGAHSTRSRGKKQSAEADD